MACAVCGCASDSSHEPASVPLHVLLPCGPAFLICLPVATAVAVVDRNISDTLDKLLRPKAEPYRLPENTSISTDMAGAAHVAQAGLLMVSKDSVKRDTSGLLTATLLIDLVAPGNNQENSYAMDVGVDCADGGMEVYRVRTYAEKGAQGKLMHTQFAGFVKRTKPGPPLDAAARAICEQGGSADNNSTRR